MTPRREVLQHSNDVNLVARAKSRPIAGRKNLRFYSPEGALDMSIFTEYISVEVYDQTPKNKLEKYLISGGSTKFSTVCVYRY